MKKMIVFLICILTTCAAFAAKYTINSSGTIKNSSGKVLSPPVQYTTQNYYNFYNNYYAPNYVNTNQVNATQSSIVEIVMDFSGSMANWISVAKNSMNAIVAQIPSSTQLGLRVFGHDQDGNNPSDKNTVREVKKIVKIGKKYKVVTEQSALGVTTGACSSTRQIARIGVANAPFMVSAMNSVYLGGATPLVYALDRTVNQDFAAFDKFSSKKIVLITDGGENCGGDPCKFASQLMKKRQDVSIDVVLVSSNSNKLACLANTTGGRMYKTDNLSDFSNTIINSIQSAPLNNNQQYQQNYEFVN